MKRFNIFSVLFIIFGILAAQNALAVCPVCTVVVSSGIGLSRYLGIDDSVTGLWIGGLTVSMIIWTMDWMGKKKISFRGDRFMVVVGYYLLILLPLYYTKLSANFFDAICSCASDRLFFSIVIGSFGFWAGAEWYNFLKEKNSGHAYFPFQKVVMPVIPLLFSSIIFYVLTK